MENDMALKKNLGMPDRLLRFGIGALFAYFGFFNHGLISDALASTVLGLFGVVLFAFAVFSHCPIYALIDFSTAREEN